MASTKWIIDSAQSSTSFSVKKLMVMTVTGNLEVFEGEALSSTDKFDNLEQLNFTARLDSLKTDDEKRDEHLKSADFFDTDKYPYLKFSAKQTDPKSKVLTGELSMRDITRPVTLQIESNRAVSGSEGQTKTRLKVSGKVNRRDFGLTWDGKKGGDIIVGDDISLSAEILFCRQHQEKAAAV